MNIDATRTKETGAVAVEFALILPLLLVLLFGIVEFGLLLYNQQVITNASREGARFGIVMSDPKRTETQITTEVDKYCQNNLVTFSTTPGVVTTDCDWSTGSGFQDLTVTVEYPYSFLVLSDFHVGSFNLGFGPIQMQARTVMKMEAEL